MFGISRVSVFLHERNYEINKPGFSGLGRKYSEGDYSFSKMQRNCYREMFGISRVSVFLHERNYEINKPGFSGLFYVLYRCLDTYQVWWYTCKKY